MDVDAEYIMSVFNLSHFFFLPQILQGWRKVGRHHCFWTKELGYPSSMVESILDSANLCGFFVAIYPVNIFPNSNLTNSEIVRK